jgi:hypothetical protein
MEVRVDLKSLPSTAGFFAALAAPSSVQARDNNSGQPVVVAPLTPGATYSVSLTVNGQTLAWSFAVSATATAP